jgi:hypothetical protein
MKRVSIFFAALLACSVALFAFKRACARAEGPDYPQSPTHLNAENFLKSPELIRWRNSEPAHWRAYALKR